MQSRSFDGVNRSSLNEKGRPVPPLRYTHRLTVERLLLLKPSTRFVEDILRVCPGDPRENFVAAPEVEFEEHVAAILRFLNYLAPLRRPFQIYVVHCGRHVVS